MSVPRDAADDANGPFQLYDLPVIDTPFTRLSEHWCSHQLGPCADFEMDYNRCLARVGIANVHKSCSQYLSDWKECAFKTKSVKRYNAMQEERKKQGLGFKQPPPPDSIHTVN